MAGVDLPFQCDCGTVRGALVGVSPANGNRVECYCKDCRAAEVFARQGRAAATGPVRLFQTSPHRVRFDQGLDHLAVFSLSPKGLLRWHARCCGAMLFNTLRSPKVAFAAFFTDRAEDPGPLGPVRTRANMQMPGGKSGHEGFARALFNFAATALPARITGRWKATPFFDPETLNPVREVRVLSRAERAAATQPTT